MKSHNVCALAVALLALAGPAFATVSVKLNENTLMNLRAPAGTVVIGNPAVADVSMLGPQRIAILGKGYGATNLIVTDRMGRVIFHEEIQVTPQIANRVVVHRGQQEATFTCAPTCESAQAPSEGAAGGPAQGASARGPVLGGQAGQAGGGGASPPPTPQ